MSLLRELRYAFRRLWESPAFLAVTTATLALTIGGNSAIFSITYPVILKRLPVPAPSRLVRYSFRNGPMDFGLSGPMYDALRRQESAVMGLLAWNPAELSVRREGNTRLVQGALLSGNGLKVLQLQPALGRGFGEQDDIPGGGPDGYKALLSYRYWQDTFHSDPAAAGRPIIVNEKAVTIAGVLPKGFEGLTAGYLADVVLPLAFEEVLNAPKPARRLRGNMWLAVFGRLKPGESLESASANLRSTEAAVRAEADPDGHVLSGFFAGFRFGLESGRGGMSLFRNRFGSALVMLQIFTALLFGLCCANVALLVLARATGRLRQYSLLVALGASPGRLVWQVVAETLLLGGAGICAGFPLGVVGARSLVGVLAGIGEPLPVDVRPDPVIFLFTAAVTLLFVLVAAISPALWVSRVDPNRGLHGDSRSTSRVPGRLFVPAQVALSLPLLTAAVLLGVTFANLANQGPGFGGRSLLMAQVGFKATPPAPGAAAHAARRMVEMLERDGVESASALSLAPLTGAYAAGHYFTAGDRGAVHTDMQMWTEQVSPDYFPTVGTRIAAGRGFARSDEGRSVCVLSQSAAAYLFPSAAPLQQVVYPGGADPSLDGRTGLNPADGCTVIGIAEDARYRSLRDPAPRMLYSLIGDELRPSFYVALRARNGAAAALALRRALNAVQPNAPEPLLFSFETLVRANLRQERLMIALSSSLALIALSLAAFGFYGVLERSLAARTREIGIRLALGSSSNGIATLFLSEAIRLALIGAALGCGMSYLVAKALEGLLYGVRPFAPSVFAMVTALVCFFTAAACCGPIIRVLRIQPMDALRHD